MSILFLCTFIFLLLLPEAVVALNPQAACATLPGGCPPANVLATTTVPEIALRLIKIASGVSLIFVVWAGVQMSKLSKARWATVWALVGLVLAITAQLLTGFTVSEVAGSSWGTEETIMANILRVIVTLFNAAFLVIIVLAGIQWVIARGQPEDIKKGKLMVAWAIAGAIVVNVGHALVRAVTTFFGI
jgi:hypothetical protein